MKLYNTLTRKIEELRPIKEGNVGIYSCGPTVYWNQHIGHMYAYVQWDVLVRFLRMKGMKVRWVMNITDVGHLTSDEDTGEDKMEKGAKREGITVWQIAEKYIKQFQESLVLLNITSPDVLCRATDHIKEQIALIQKIEENGFAYKTKTGLVFDTSKFADYSRFAGLNLDKQNAGARVEVDKDKKNPWDFLLWVTNQPEHIMKWDSPWGTGFPGWHIECTAMSVKYLGEKFDIHTGGKEHIPVHHTNEIAQGYGAFGQQTANFWLHNNWLLIEGEKMSKSLGNNVLVTDLISKGYSPVTLRYLILNSHYRQGMNFTWKAMEAAGNAVESIKNIIPSVNSKITDSDIDVTDNDYVKKFIEALDNDLNVTKGLAVFWDALKSKLPDGEKYKTLLKMDRVLGLDLVKLKVTDDQIPDEILKLCEEREKYRKDKNFIKSDEIRKEIERLGYYVKDTPKGPEIQKA